MSKNKKQRLRTAYQRHIDFWKILGIALLAFTMIAVAVVGLLLETQAFNLMMYILLVSGAVTFILGIIVSLIGSMKQTVADEVYDKLYAVWKYKPSTIYNFYRKQSRYEKKSRSLDWLITTAILLIVSTIMVCNNVSYYLGLVFYGVSAISLVICICYLPYVRYLLLKLRTFILGDAKEIIFSRAGIWYCGRICYFGSTGVTYHRVERKELHGQDAIVFYYTQTRGFQQIPRELAIPVSSKMAYAADELVDLFNRSDLIQDLNIKH